MSRGVRLLLLLSITVLLAACGGSSHSSSTTSAAATTTSSSAATATTASASTPTSSAAGAQPGSTSSASSTSIATTPPSKRGSTNVRVPATFVVGSGGKLNPPVITVPAFFAVQFTVASGDERAHQVVLKTPVLHTLNVPAHGRASLRIPGLRAGQYQVEVDGSVAGSLVIGGEPGP